MCWVALIAHHQLTGPHAAHATSLATTVPMWGLMTLAMMAPTAVPVLATLRDLLHRSSLRQWWTFLGVYLVVWSGFAVMAAALQWRLVELGVLGADGSSRSRLFSAGVLAVAATYQFTAVKSRCLTECVRPMTFFLQHWRDGVGGAARMGVRHGITCLGCCWALMLLAFVGGIANIWFMVLAAVVMTIEKLPAIGRRVTFPLGALLLAGSVAMVLGAGSDTHDLLEHPPSIASIGQPKGIP